MQPTASARRAFLLLVALGGACLALLASLLAWQGQRLAEGVWLACQDAAAAVGGVLPALGLLLPVLILVLGLLAASASATWQLWHTHRLVRVVSRRVTPLPQPVAALVDRLDLRGRVLLVDDVDAYAFTQGLARPRIWLSTVLVDLLDEDELAAVLLHERHHLRQRDPLRVWLSRTLADGLFYVPMAATLRNAYLVAKETEADAASQANTALASALLKLLRHGSTLPAHAHLAAIGPLDVTALRIERLLGRRSGSGRFRLLAAQPVVVTLLVVLAMITVSGLSTARAAAPLAGGECGYTTQAAPVELPVTPADYTPAGGRLQ